MLTAMQVYLAEVCVAQRHIHKPTLLKFLPELSSTLHSQTTLGRDGHCKFEEMYQSVSARQCRCNDRSTIEAPAQPLTVPFCLALGSIPYIWTPLEKEVVARLRNVHGSVSCTN